MRLIKHFQDTIPSDAKQILFDSLLEIETLPGLNNWEPKDSSFMSLGALLSIGFPLTFLKNNTSFDEHRHVVSRHLLDEKEIDHSVWAEVTTAAFCLAIGAKRTTHIKKSNKYRTPDLETEWPNGNISDIEVVSGKRKEIEIERYNIGSHIANRVGVQDHNFDIIIHCSPDVIMSTADTIISAAKSLKLGDTISIDKLWSIRGEEIKREPHVIHMYGEEIDKPSWYSYSGYDKICFHTVLGTKDETFTRPQTKCIMSIPIISYLNPVLRKATRTQSNNNSFIISFDITNLPGAFKELEVALPGFLDQWDHISGILAFRYLDYGFNTASGWQKRYYLNKHRTIDSPLEFAFHDMTETTTDSICFFTKRAEDSYIASKRA